jgi:hypothetical protein
VHVVDGRGLGSSNGLIEGLDLVVIVLRIVGSHVLLHELTEVGVGLVAGVVAFGHLRNGALFRLRLVAIVFPGGHDGISQADR